MNKLAKQRLLLKSIFRACGGPTELEKETEIPRQNFTNWQIRGKVPLLAAIKLSKKLGISKWGLNFLEFCEVDDDPMSWEEVVGSYLLPKSITVKLLKGNDPCEKKPKKKSKKKQKQVPTRE